MIFSGFQDIETPILPEKGAVITKAEAGNHRNRYGAKTRADGYLQAGAIDSARLPEALRSGADREVPASLR